MAGPSKVGLAFRNNWGRRRGFALAVVPSVLRIARSDAKESQRRCPVTSAEKTHCAFQLRQWLIGEMKEMCTARDHGSTRAP